MKIFRIWIESEIVSDYNDKLIAGSRERPSGRPDNFNKLKTAVNMLVILAFHRMQRDIIRNSTRDRGVRKTCCANEFPNLFAVHISSRWCKQTERSKKAFKYARVPTSFLETHPFTIRCVRRVQTHVGATGRSTDRKKKIEISVSKNACFHPVNKAQVNRSYSRNRNAHTHTHILWTEVIISSK